MADNHPSSCMCSGCQDEALAIELRSQAKEERLIVTELRKQISDLRYANDVLTSKLEAAQEEAQDNLYAMPPEMIRTFEDIRAERDALQRRIDNAPMGRVAISDNFVQPLTAVSKDIKGKRVALVVLGDDDE